MHRVTDTSLVSLIPCPFTHTVSEQHIPRGGPTGYRSAAVHAHIQPTEENICGRCSRPSLSTEHSETERRDRGGETPVSVDGKRRGDDHGPQGFGKGHQAVGI